MVSGLGVGRALVVGRYRIIPIEDRLLTTCRGVAGGWLFAERRLHALVLCDGPLVRCLDAEGNERELSSLLARLPELAEALAR